jgi:hypothetical protein
MSINIQQIIRPTLICIIPILTFSGCANLTKAPTSEPQQISPGGVNPEHQVLPAAAEPKVGEADQTQQPECFVHTVKWPGETLSHIAKWYTGKFGNWKILADANPGLNPNKIYSGNEIRIPEDVLNTRKPLPKDFLARFIPSKGSSQPKAENELPLFGPKEYPQR